MLVRVGSQVQTIDRVETLTGFRALEAEWQQLLLDDPSHTIFQTFSWLLSWWEVFGIDRELYLLAARIDGEIVAIAPLMRHSFTRHGRTQKVIEFIGTPNADYADIIAGDKEQAWTAVLDYLDTHREDWDNIDLARVNDRSPSCAILSTKLREPRWYGLKSRQETSLAFEYTGPEAERTAFHSRGKARLRKAAKALEKLGGLQYQRLHPSEVRNHLARLFQMHVTRWRNTSTPSKFLQSEHRQFYHLLAERLSQANHITLTSLTSGELPACYCFGFDYRGVIHYYTISHNLYFARWSPGDLLLNCQAGRFIRAGRMLDYSRGVQGYEKLLANRMSTNYRFEVFADRAALRRARLISAVKQHPLIRRMLGHPSWVSLRTRLAQMRFQEGIGGLVRRLLCRGLRVVWSGRTFNVLEFSGDINRSIAPAVDVAMRQLSEEDLPIICSLYGVEADSRKFHTFQKRFRSGAECWGGFHNGQLISIGWCIFTQDIDSSSGFVLKAGPGEVILADGLSSELYRGLRIRPYLINLEIEHYQSKGMKVITAVDQTNIASIHNVARIGFKKVRQVRVVRLFGLRII